MPSQGIQLLDMSVIHQLRSSLVINTLPQCLKELIQNALDASSTSIEVLIDIEKFSLQVNDNGCGIQNMSKIGQRHVTSKCHTLSDINQLKTFGFRGEALSAITNEAMVQIISRHYSTKDTFEGFWRDGNIIGTISHSKHTKKNQPGTTVIVRDLFYKFPVRRKYSSANVYQHVVMMESVKRLISAFALCFHDVNFTLIDSSRNMKILSTKRSSSSQDIFRRLFGQELAKHTKSLKLQEDKITVDGFFSTCGYPNKSQQYIYVNDFILPSNSKLYKVVSDLILSSNFAMEDKQDNTQDITKYNSKGRSSTQRYPIFLIKCTCSEWSYFELSMYLDILTEFAAFHLIELALKRFTTNFLKLSGLWTNINFPTPSISVENSNKRKPTICESKSTSKYLEHSSCGAASITQSGSSSFLSAYSSSWTSNANNGEQKSEYLTWKDPKLEQTFYIDPRTGNSYPAPPTIMSTQNSHTHKNSVNRSHLKKQKLHHNQSYETTERKSLDRTSRNILSQKENLFSDAVPGNIVDIPHKLSKMDLQNAQVLGQVDKKYIVIKLNGNNQSLVFIDQHAADERVQLEDMLRNEATFTPTTLEPSICLEMDSFHEYQILTSERILNYLKTWGVHIVTTATPLYNAVNSTSKDTQFYEDDDTNSLISESRFFSNSDISPHFATSNLTSRKFLNRIYVTQMPQIIMDRCTVNHSLLKDIIRNYAYWISGQQDDHVLLRKSCPKGIIEILKSRACRGAIMFNDLLSLDQCQDIVRKLSTCNFPFQCAHGRPSVVPVHLNLDSMNDCERNDRGTNWSKFSKLKS